MNAKGGSATTLVLGSNSGAKVIHPFQTRRRAQWRVGALRGCASPGGVQGHRVGRLKLVAGGLSPFNQREVLALPPKLQPGSDDSGTLKGPP